MKLPKFRPGDYVRERLNRWHKGELVTELGPVGIVTDTENNWVLVRYTGKAHDTKVDKRQCIKLSEMDVMIYMLE